MTIAGLPDETYRLRHRRLDERHSNLVRRWRELGGEADWPTDGQWKELIGRDVLDELEPPRVISVTDTRIELAFDLPMPSVSLIELSPG
jgi:xylan 1,4-beta-xylosidase